MQTYFNGYSLKRTKSCTIK